MSTEALDPATFSSIYEAMRAEQRGHRREVIALAALDITEALRASPFFNSDPLIYAVVKSLARGGDPVRVLVEAVVAGAEVRANMTGEAIDAALKPRSIVGAVCARCSNMVTP